MHRLAFLHMISSASALTHLSKGLELHHDRALAMYEDIQLKLPDVLTDVCSETDHQVGVTNPSLIPISGSDDVLVAFRGLCLGNLPMPMSTRWTSYIVLGSTPSAEVHSGKTELNWSNFSRVPDPRAPRSQQVPGKIASELNECLDPKRSLYALAEGPEDPRLFQSNGKTYMTFIAQPLISEPTGSDYNNSVSQLFGRPACNDTLSFIPHVVELLSLPPNIEFGPVLPLTFEGMHREEKNWSPLAWKPLSGPEQAFFVYDMYPHTILSADLSTGRLTKKYAKNSTHLVNLASKMQLKPQDFHCNGAGAIPVLCADGTDCKLSIFHAHYDRGVANRTYQHWPYKFSAAPPFEIKAVGKSLPLKARASTAISGGGWVVSFVTSIMSDDSEVLIGYNTGDQDSHVFRSSLAEFESNYFE